MISLESVLAILGMAAVTMMIKASGLVLAERLPRTGFTAAFLRHIPGAVLASLVAPSVLSGGPAEWGAAGLTALAFLLTRNLFVAMAAGILAVYLIRLLLA